MKKNIVAITCGNTKVTKKSFNEKICSKMIILPFDLANELERLSKDGYCPLVLNDDNGNWCVADEGHGPMRISNEQDFSFSVFGEASWFKPTVKEAWMNYIERLRELGNEV